MILITAIEALREEKKKRKTKKKKKHIVQTAPGESTMPKSTPLDVTSVEAAEAWTGQNTRTNRKRWFDGLKIMGE